MTIAQKMLDERKLGYLEGLEDAIVALKGVLDPEVIAERFKMPLNQVLDILNQEQRQTGTA